jgi:adenine-specific DNA methylase
MSKEIGRSDGDDRRTLPIEKGFPIERVNEIAAKEGRAKQWYRPVYTMHKWWARRLGCVFRTISLYSLVEDPATVEVHEPGENENLSDFSESETDISELIDGVDVSNPESLWKLYSKDVRVSNKKILDPFMGGGTSVIEGSRFGASVDGNDLNPVAWFISKKEAETGHTDPEDLKEAFEKVKSDVSEEILQYYRTPCPNVDGDHQADVMYNFWVKELDCVSCGSTVSLFRDYRLGSGRYENDGQYNVICPSCDEITLVDDWQSECTCSNCDFDFIPKEGNIDYGDYVCPDCGQKYPVTDTIEEQGGFDLRLYAVEYYCPHCDESGRTKNEVKSYKLPENHDEQLFEQAVNEWEESTDLRQYVPDKSIRPGWKTDANQFDGSMGGNGNLPRHGYTKWTDMFNERQLLCLSKLAEAIEDVENENIREYLLLAFSDSLRMHNMMTTYNTGYNKIDHIFKTNSFTPQMAPTENNIWGTEYGLGTFEKVFDMVMRGVKYGNEPTERYISDGETVETKPFQKSVGENVSVKQGDARNIDAENEYDCVITDPPYYNNVLYSELSDFFYVWLKPLLKDNYDCFEMDHTPRSESIVVNPASDKNDEDFETELKQAFSAIKTALKADGILAFTYHHSSSESWGELLQALCDVGFEVTATYPVSADIEKFLAGESVEFDIIIVARPAKDRQPISWNSLRRNIYRTAQKTRQRLEENRDLSRGDIGVVEMGRCFHEYSKHHGKVERAGETMTAKEVVDEIYGVIQHGSDIGEIDVFLDLLETPDASYDDLNKLTRGTNATPERMEDMRLYRMDDGFTLGTWDDEKRIAYIQSRVDGDEELTNLDKAQFLRYRWQHGKSIPEYLDKWDITDDLRELCEGLADATGDDTYRNILESRLSDY